MRERPVHLANDDEGYAKAVHTRLPFYRSVCDQVPKLSDLTNEKSRVTCETCRAMVGADRKVEPRPVVTDESVDLSDYDAVASLVDDGAPPPRIAVAATPVTRRSFREPRSVPTLEVLAKRIGLDPKTDPDGVLGEDGVDIRTVLSEVERVAMGNLVTIAADLGAVDMAGPVVRAFYRLCFFAAQAQAPVDATEE